MKMNLSQETQLLQLPEQQYRRADKRNCILKVCNRAYAWRSLKIIRNSAIQRTILHFLLWWVLRTIIFHISPDTSFTSYAYVTASLGFAITVKLQVMYDLLFICKQIQD